MSRAHPEVSAAPTNRMRALGRTRARWIGAILLAVLTVMAVPTLPTSSAANAAPREAHHSSALATSRGGPAPPTALGPFELRDGATIPIEQLLPYYIRQQQAIAGALHESNPFNRSTLANASSAAMRAPAASTSRHPAVAHSSVGGSGTVTGQVVDSVSLRGLAGVNLTLEAAPTFSCATSSCAYATSGSGGTFSLTGASGPSILAVSDVHYLENDTVIQVPNGSTTDLGEVQLVHDFYVMGRVVGADRTHEPAVNVSIAGSSRDGTLLGSTAVTGSNGTFDVELPPVPSYVSFTPRDPHGPYGPNQTFVNGAPNSTIDLGDVYLPRGVALNVQLIDDLTGKPILPSPEPWMYLAACARDTNACPFDGAHENQTVWALPGPTYLVVEVLGFLENITEIPAVPFGSEYTTIIVPVRLTPEAIAVFRTGLTGGNPPASVASNSGGYVIPCSLSGLILVHINPLPKVNNSAWVIPDHCDPATQSYRDFTAGQMVLVPPLRVEFDIVGHGTSNGTAGFLPVFGNTTWFNASAGQVIDIGTIDLTPGGWVSGRVVAQGTGSAPPGGFTVQACSTDESGWCGGNVVGGGNCRGQLDPAQFCVAVPPGPSRLSVTSQSVAVSNVTWVYVRPYCCNLLGPLTPKLDLANVTSDHIREINVSTTSIGEVTGRVMERLADGVVQPGALISVTICPVGTLVPVTACPFATTDLSGRFWANVSTGWQDLTVDAEGEAPNGTWVDVTGLNSSGTIWIEPDGTFVGTAVTPGGVPVPGAITQVCPVSEPTVCSTSGFGPTYPGGVFSGEAPAGIFPGSAFRFDVSALGYSDGSAWGNLSSGSLTNLGQVVLVPTGVGTGQRPEGLAPASVVNAGSTWVDGSVVDARTGDALWGYTIQACPVLTSSGCQSFSDSPTALGGWFNGSITNGGTVITISELGFYSNRTYVNLTGAPVHLGVIHLDPYPRVLGRLEYGPWPSLTFADGLAPQGSTVQACDPTGTTCGLPSSPDTAGWFNASGPAGTYDTFRITVPSVSTPDGTPGTGISGYSATITVPAGGTTLPDGPTTAPELRLYGSVKGHVGDSTTLSGTAGARLPVRYGVVTAQVGGTAGYTLSENLTGGGDYQFFLPPGANVSITAGGSSYWRGSENATAPATTGNRTLSPLYISHYGWVTFDVRQLSPSAGIPLAGVSAATYDAHNRTWVTGYGLSDASGYTNLSAPPGDPVLITASPSGYVPGNVTATVLPSTTTPVALRPLGGSGGGTWVSSEQVNTVGVAPTLTVVDPVARSPLALASVFIDNDLGQPATNPVFTNSLGQFLISALSQANASFAVEKADYATNATLLPTVGSVFRYSTLNMTGDGVVSGRIVEGFHHQPIEGAGASACLTVFPYSCQTVYSNASGDWWIGVPPGTTAISFSADGFVANATIDVVVCSDCFVDVGTTPLWNDAEVAGTVVAAPDDGPVGNANVSLCPIDVIFYAYCVSPAATDASGGFAMAVTAGTYYLNVTYPGYAPFGFILGLQAGEYVNVGTLEIVPNGTLEGSVVSSSTDLPIADASVSACPPSGSYACTTGTTSSGGRYSFQLAPGPYTVSASSSGYLTESESVTAVSDSTISANTIYLPYLGPGQNFAIAGTVSSGTGPGAPVDGALVRAVSSGVAVDSTSTNTSGGFELSLAWGSYQLVVTASGYATNSSPLTVHGPQSGLTVALAPFAWGVRGSASVAESGAEAPGATVSYAGKLLATADSAGAFSFGLANGSYNLTVAPSAALGRYVAPVPVAITVRGVTAPFRAILPLLLVETTLSAVDARSGAPIPEASLLIRGELGVSVPYSTNASAGSSGLAFLSLPVGSFTVNATARGYVPANTSFVVSGAPLQVTVVLTQTRAHSTGGGTPWLLDAELAGGTVTVLAALALVYWWRRRSGPRHLRGSVRAQDSDAPIPAADAPPVDAEFYPVEDEL
ncbi:MAG TPA: carboxypeptidase-like regulatory domain-containing protein [Thermoplasmata archaeon]|nr:carboxypeptidase-like regulatory domain-containing protein [Thermoplasmata archaeon]